MSDMVIPAATFERLAAFALAAMPPSDVQSANFQKAVIEDGVAQEILSLTLRLKKNMGNKWP